MILSRKRIVLLYKVMMEWRSQAKKRLTVKLKQGQGQLSYSQEQRESPEI